MAYDVNQLLSVLDHSSEENFLLEYKELLKQMGVENPQELLNRSHDLEFAEQLNRQIMLSRGRLGELFSPGTRQEVVEKLRHQGAVGRLAEGIRNATSSALDRLMPKRKKRREEQQAQEKKEGEDRLYKRRMEAMNQYGRRADAKFKRRVREYFPAYRKSLGLRNKTMGTHAVGDLLLIAADGERYKDGKLKHEAIRKVVNMVISADNDRMTEVKKQQAGFFINLSEERFYDPNGENEGGTNTQWLVTTHDPDNDYKSTDYEYHDTPPSSLGEHQLIEQIDFRATIVTDKKTGEKRKIRYMLDFDIKDEDSIDDKTQRHPERPVDERTRDVVRAKAIFDSEEEADLVTDEWIRRISKPDDLTQKSYHAYKDKRKNGVGVVDKNDPTKKAIPCNKFNLVVDNEGELMDLEIQAFVPKAFRDYEAWKRHCWVSHKAKRYFESGLYKREYPEKIYGKIPVETVMAKMIDRGHQEIIEDLREIVVPTHEKIRVTISTPEEASTSEHVELKEADIEAPFSSLN